MEEREGRKEKNLRIINGLIVAMAVVDGSARGALCDSASEDQWAGAHGAF